MTADELAPVPLTSFSTELIKERQDLQRLLRKQLSLLGDDLLFVAEEYAAFQDSKRRVDLLAVDKTGRLVVIELKRTDDGGHMELQALRYAAMVSTMTFDQLVSTYADNNTVSELEARQAIGEWIEGIGEDDLDDALDVLDNKVRIILVSANFSTEVTSTVLWLNQEYGLDIQCWRLVPYRLHGDVLVDMQQLIPLPESADFQIKQRDKNLETVAAKVRASTKDYTKYDVTVEGKASLGLSKQSAVSHLVRELLHRGIAGHEIRNVLTPKRWLPVQRMDGESVEDAFHRSYPDRGDGYWFDIGMQDGSGVWVMPRLGGTKTELYLQALVNLAADRVPTTWSRSHD
jgi:hypothetical protein